MKADGLLDEKQHAAVLKKLEEERKAATKATSKQTTSD
jgi:hypothetical protein